MKVLGSTLNPGFLQWVNDGSTLTSFITWACWDVFVSEDLVRLQVGLEQLPSTGHWLLQCTRCSWLGLLNLLMMKSTSGLHHKGHLSEIELRVHSSAMWPKLHIQCPDWVVRITICFTSLSQQWLVHDWLISHLQNLAAWHYHNPAVCSALIESRGFFGTSRIPRFGLDWFGSSLVPRILKTTGFCKCQRTLPPEKTQENLHVHSSPWFSCDF